MSLNIYIAAHKDFQWCPVNKDYKIICGKDELRNTYPVEVITERSTQHYVDLHDSYAELTRLYHIYRNVKPLPEYIGFCQYKRYFDFYDKTASVENIMKHHDAILPSVTPAGPNVLKSYASYHRKQDLEQCIDIIKKLFPEMSKTTDSFIKSYGLRANNMFIMKRNDFRDYCKFIFEVFDELDKQNNWNTMDDMKKCGIVQRKTHGFLAERISNIFFLERFKTPLTKGIIIKR